MPAASAGTPINAGAHSHEDFKIEAAPVAVDVGAD